MDLKVTVAYALPSRQLLLGLQVPAGTSLREAILRSGLLEQVPELDLGPARVGVFGRLRDLCEPVAEGDRIEVYRALLADPKTARRERARGTRLKPGLNPGA